MRLPTPVNVLSVMDGWVLFPDPEDLLVPPIGGLVGMYFSRKKTLENRYVNEGFESCFENKNSSCTNLAVF